MTTQAAFRWQHPNCHILAVERSTRAERSRPPTRDEQKGPTDPRERRHRVRGIVHARARQGESVGLCAEDQDGGFFSLCSPLGRLFEGESAALRGVSLAF